MKYWNSYTGTIRRNCGGVETVRDMAYWRDTLFASIIIYMLPFCFIALIPGLCWVFFMGQHILAIADLVAVVGVCIVAFMPGISQPKRKILFIVCIYIFSCALLYFIGLSGPGLVYLLAASVFCILVIPTTYKFWPAWVNTFICFAFTVAILFDIIPWARTDTHSAGEWIAVSTNLIFLNFLLAALIPGLFHGLQETLDKEKQLTEKVSKQQSSLEEALNMLHQKNKDLEQFAYVASHDLKEPLRMVTSFMALLKNKYGNQLDAKAHTYIDFAIDGGKRMQKMISDLLELSRIARKDMTREAVNLGEVVKDVKQDILKLIEENSAEVIIETELPSLLVYKSDITRLFQNLLTNAIKFKKKETKTVIKVNATEKDKEWLFSIEDNGIGIEQEKFEKIFEIFTRLHSQEAYKGTGIGLAICKKVVEHHQGRIWIQSQEGKGTTFYFTIKK